MLINKRFRSIDILKGIAIIMITIVHYEQSFNICKWCWYFQMGCPIFFVCSGFSIMCLINNKFSGKINKNNIMNFYSSRLKALVPGWYIAFLIIFIVNTILLKTTGNTLSFGINRNPISILCNLLFLHGLLPFCNNNVMPGGWYIGTTAILYLLTPAIFNAFTNSKNKNTFFCFSSAISLIIWTILFLIFKSSFVNEEGFGYFIFLIHYPSYLLGFILYNKLNNISKNIENKSVFFALFLFVLSYVSFYSNIAMLKLFSSWLTALSTYYILSYLIRNENNIGNNLALSTIEKFGRNSYYIYLIHAFFVWTFPTLILYLNNKSNFRLNELIIFVILYPIVLLLSYLAGKLFAVIVKKILYIWRRKYEKNFKLF